MRTRQVEDCRFRLIFFIAAAFSRNSTREQPARNGVPRILWNVQFSSSATRSQSGEAAPRKEKRTKQDRLSLRELLRPHLPALIIGFVAVVGESAANLLEPWPLKLVLDDVLRSHQSHESIMRHIYGFIGTDKIGVLKVACLAVLAIAVLDGICSFAEKYLTTSVAQWVAYDLRRAIYSHVQKLSLSYHDHKRTGDLISRITDDIDAIQSFIQSSLLTSLVNVITLVGMVGVMFYLNWRFTLIALSVAPVLAILVYTYTRRIKKAARAVRKKEGEITSLVEEVLSSIRVVKAFAREEYEVKRLEEESLENVELALRARSLKAKLTPFVGLVVAVGTALVLWFGARLVLAGALSVGSLVVFILYLGKMYKPMQELSKTTDTYSKAAVGYERVYEVLDIDGQIKDLPRAIRAPRFQGKIEFEHVSFSYTREAPVLNDVSFSVQPGQVAALVGPTGAGKTTIISLLPRFYDPASGVIKIDGTDIRRFQQKYVRRQISFVLQDTVLFHSTVWQNIAYGNPETSRRKIIQAAEAANASEFIEKLPQGYDTILGERGMTLSGGQRQRLAIARAVVRNTPILILDEPTASLDSESEQLVLEALHRLMEGKTAIIITHRLSIIQHADVILVIQHGRVVEQGRHEALLRRGGLYAQLHDIQFNGEESYRAS